MNRARSGDRVRVEYRTPSKRDATVWVPGPTVLEFTVGGPQAIPGISSGVMGMAEGECKQLTLQPAEAFGAVRQKFIREIPRARFPGLDLRVGKRLAKVDAAGRRRVAKIVELKAYTVVVDANHPLAGKVLTVEIRLLSLQSATARELPQDFDTGGEG